MLLEKELRILHLVLKAARSLDSTLARELEHRSTQSPPPMVMDFNKVIPTPARPHLSIVPLPTGQPFKTHA